MSVNRRFMLKGASLSGIAGLAMGSATRALAGAVNAADRGEQSVLALVNHGAVAALFLQGATVASGTPLRVQRVNDDPDLMLAFDQQIRGGEPLRIIGLLDDALATLALDMARGAGARVQWVGLHHAAAGVTHHHLQTADVTEDYSRQLGPQWVASLGYLLAALGTHSSSITPWVPAASAPVVGSFVSFSIEVRGG